jgi:hypothetical protein
MRTLATLAALAVALAAPGASSGLLAASAHHARLTASGNDPLKVRGAGFRAHERVRLTITPATTSRIVRHVRASTRGTFLMSFAKVEACAGVAGVATGNRGSHASFQLSSFVC